MWVYVGTEWLQEDEPPRLRPGDCLSGSPVVASCWTVQASTCADGISDERPPDPDGGSWCTSWASGTLLWTGSSSAVQALLQVAEDSLIAEPRWRKRGPRWWPGPLSFDRGFASLSFPPAGSRVTLHGILTIQPAWAIRPLPDDAPAPTSDWEIRQTRIERRSRTRKGSGDLVQTSEVGEADCEALESTQFGVHVVEVASSNA